MPRPAPTLPRIAPMLARSARALPAGPEWRYEVKWDGWRALVYVEGGAVRLVSRRGIDLTRRFPELQALGRALRRSAVLDAELCVLDEHGRPDFEALQSLSSPATLVVFDLLHLGARSLLQSPWEERRRELERLQLEGPRWSTPPPFDEGVALLEACREHQLEGVVAKRRDAPYAPGERSRAWVKVKTPEWLSANRQRFEHLRWRAAAGRRP